MDFNLIFAKFNLISHIVAGSVALLTGFLAVFTNANSRTHRRVGKVFFYSMCYVCFSATLGYLRNPSPFFLFLVGISGMVIASILPAVRAIQMMKGDTVRSFDIPLAVFGLLVGGVMLSIGAYILINTNNGFFLGVLFSAFGFGTFMIGLGNYRLFSRPLEQHKLDWLLLHVRLMLTALIASVTAFAVNAKFLTEYFNMYALWFGPTLLITPLQIYFTSKIRNQKKAILARKA